MTDRLINHFPAPTHAPGDLYWIPIQVVQWWLSGQVKDEHLAAYLYTLADLKEMKDDGEALTA